MKNKISGVKQLLKRNAWLNDIVSWCYTRYHNFTSTLRQVGFRGAYVHHCKFSIHKGSRVEIGPLARVKNCKFHLSGKNCRIIIGGGKTVLRDVSFCCEDDNSMICIGNDFTMEGGEIAAIEGRKVIVGNDCMFSAGIDIRNGDSHVVLENVTKERLNTSDDICIGNHVWLTRKVAVLKGAVIADNSIVGHSAVVTGKCSEPNCIYAGIPARLIKRNIDWSRFRTAERE